MSVLLGSAASTVNGGMMMENGSIKQRLIGIGLVVLAVSAFSVPSLASDKSSPMLTEPLPNTSLPQTTTPQRQLGQIFIDASQSQRQTVEFVGEGARPVSNNRVDKYSVYQNKNTTDPTEFGGGVKFNATDDFSISVQAGGELGDENKVDVDSGSVSFEFKY